jgi:hypothetical protein
MACGSNENGDSTKKTIVKVLLCTETNQCFVKHLVEKILPVVFWLSILGAFVFSFKIANIGSRFGGGFEFTTFLIILIGSLIAILISFYLIYAVKTIKDALTGGEDTCGCGCELDNEESADAVVVESVESSVTAAKPERKKPGPKAGSARGRKKEV